MWAESWQVTFRDVVILDGQGEKVGVYNLTNHNLATAANFSELKTKLVDAALTTQSPYHNRVKPSDVDSDKVVAPLDALLILTELNARGSGKLHAPAGTQTFQRYDTKGEGWRPAPAPVRRRRINVE